MLFSAKIAAIEFEGDEVRVAVISTGGKLPAILDLQACRAEYEDPEDRFEAMVQALDNALERVKSVPTLYLLCVNGANAIARNINIPFRGRRRVASAVQFELEPYLAFPIDDLMLDFNIVAEMSGETAVLAMGLRRSLMEEQLAILEAAGVTAEAVSLDVVGATGLWHAAQKGAKGLQAVLHVRDGGAALAITHNRTLAHIRHLNLTAEKLIESPTAAAREVQNSIRAFMAQWNAEGEIDTLHVTGIEFHGEQRETFERAVGLIVEDTVLLSFLKGGTRAADQSGTGPEHNTWEPLIGVALGGTGGGFSIDFKRAENDWRGAVRGVIANLTFSAFLAGLFLMGLIFYYMEGAKRFDAEAAQIQENIDALNTDIEELSGKLIDEDINLDIFTAPLPLDILLEIGKRMKMPGDQLRIRGLEIHAPDARTSWLTIRGEADSPDIFNQAFAELKKSEMFRLDEETDLRTESGVTQFTVKAYRIEEKSNDDS